MLLAPHCWLFGGGPEDGAASGCGASSSVWVPLASAAGGAEIGFIGGERSRRWIAFSTSMYDVLSSCLCARCLGGGWSVGCGGGVGAHGIVRSGVGGMFVIMAIVHMRRALLGAHIRAGR